MLAKANAEVAEARFEPTRTFPPQINSLPVPPLWFYLPAYEDSSLSPNCGAGGSPGPALRAFSILRTSNQIEESSYA